MLPFPKSSSDSNPVETMTPTDPVSSADTTAHKKPSLRILDEGPVNREEDLSYGPLLRSIGIGAHEYETIDALSQMGPDIVLEGSDQPEASGESLLPSLPLRLPTVLPLQTMSHSELSDTGGTFSLPADGLSSVNFSQCCEVKGCEGQEAHPAARNGAFDPFPRDYEFSWENSRLLFAGEPFEIIGAAETRSSIISPSSEIASTTHPASHPGSQTQLFRDRESQCVFPGAGLFAVGGSAESWPEGEVGRDLEIASAACSVSNSSSSSESIPGNDRNKNALDSTQVIIAREKTIDCLVQLLLDDYVRSYAPQRSQKRRNTAQDHNEHCEGRSSGRRTGRNDKLAKRASGRPRRRAIGGSGDSEDEDSHEGGQGSPGPARSTSLIRFACPFLKWKPHGYKTTCWLQLKDISHVKDHLKKRHYDPDFPHCPTCYLVFSKDGTTDHHCDLEAIAPVALITRDKFKAIKKRADGKKPPEEQWYHLYRVLFPNEPLCLDPYFNGILAKRMTDAEHYFNTERVQTLLLEALNSILEPERVAEIMEAIYGRWLPQVISEYPSGGQYPSGALGERGFAENQAAEPTYLDQNLDPGAVDVTISQPTDSYDFQYLPDPTAGFQISPLVEKNGQFASMPSMFDNQTSIEGVDDWESLNTMGFRDSELTEPQTDILDVPVDYFGLLTDTEFFSYGDEFSLLDPEEDDTYETRNAGVFPMWNF